MRRLILVVLVMLVAAFGFAYHLGTQEPDPVASSAASAAPERAQQVARGLYLTRAGDCFACHTTRGGAPYAGGRVIRTPFGDIYSSNITPDEQTGIGSWSADDFWRALHHGKGKGGKLLYPAFPYPNFTRISRADSDAMYAYFRSLTPVRQKNREPELRFPFNHRALLVAWRALYFRSGVYQEQPGQGAEWNRGAYLVQGLGHCAACHTARNVLGATIESDLSGAMIPMLNWYAPPLNSATEAGFGDWEVEDLADLLRSGVSVRGVVSGPMSEVVWQSLQYLDDKDLRAIAVYLKSVPQAGETEEAVSPKCSLENHTALRLGANIYAKHCAACHKAEGTGMPPHYPPLAGSRGVMLEQLVNPVRIVLYGGYPPSTQTNPRPYGMPPFGNVLSDEEVAAVVSYIRNAWGNQGSMVLPSQVNRYRAVPLE